MGRGIDGSRPPGLLRFTRLALIGACLAASAANDAGESFDPRVGAEAPALALRDVGGRDVSLVDFRGRVVVVNFWATWCAPCVEELPSLQRMRDRLAREGVEVLAVNLQENAARIEPFLAKLGIALTVLRDHDGSARTTWNVTVLPSTFVVGPDQTIVFAVEGPTDWSTPWTVARIGAATRR